MTQAKSYFQSVQNETETSTRGNVDFCPIMEKNKDG